MTRQKEQGKNKTENKRGNRKVESHDSSEIPDRRVTSDIPGLPSGKKRLEGLTKAPAGKEQLPPLLSTLLLILSASRSLAPLSTVLFSFRSIYNYGMTFPFLSDTDRNPLWTHSSVT